MPKLIKKRSEKAGLPPGTPVHIGEKRIEKAKITVLDYDESRFQEKQVGRGLIIWLEEGEFYIIQQFNKRHQKELY